MEVLTTQSGANPVTPIQSSGPTPLIPSLPSVLVLQGWSGLQARLPRLLFACVSANSTLMAMHRNTAQLLGFSGSSHPLCSGQFMGLRVDVLKASLPVRGVPQHVVANTNCDSSVYHSGMLLFGRCECVSLYTSFCRFWVSVSFLSPEGPAST